MLALMTLHFALALLMFLVVNWIGRHSVGRGYMSMGLLPKVDEAPALNAAIRIATPLVFLLLSASVLYAVGWDELVRGWYLIAVYYVVFRWAFNLLWGRARLLNWSKEVLFGAVIVGGAWGLDRHVISERVNVLPDMTTIANEIWIMVAVYLFYVANQVRTNDRGTVARKKRYILAKAETFRGNFREEIKEATGNAAVVSIILAIMVYENFNRPKPARFIERIGFRLGLAKTLGLMQVTSRRSLSDRESVKLGIARIIEAWHRETPTDRPNPSDHDVLYSIAWDYNPDREYVAEIRSIAAVIRQGLFDEESRSLSRYEPLLEESAC